jgi:hypothetical protein
MLRCLSNMVTRRSFLGGVVAAAASGALFSRSAEATVMRSASLGDLLGVSAHVVLGSSVDSFAQWEPVGQRQCIVTYSAFRIEELLHGSTPSSSEVTIRTLGGQTGGLGQIFYGEAVVALQERAAVFLYAHGPGLFSVTEMTQGYYPVKPDEKGVARLRASLFDGVIDKPDSAMHRLHGRTLPEARDLFVKERVLAR